MTSQPKDFQLNDAVTISPTGTGELIGTIAHLGPVQFAPGSDWIGIKLTNSSMGRGENNGTVNGIFYFDAGGENNGMFVRRVDVTKLEEGNGSVRKYGSNTPSPRKTSTRSESNSSEMNGESSIIKSPVTSAVAASRENFLCRLEKQQVKRKESVAGEVKESVDGNQQPVTESVETNMARSTKQQPRSSVTDTTTESKEATISSTTTARAQEPTQPILNETPRHKYDEMATVTSFLSTQTNLTNNQSSMEWVKDIDTSSLMFLNGLASRCSSVCGEENASLSQSNMTHDQLSMDWIKDVDASSMAYLKNFASTNAFGGRGNVTAASPDGVSTPGQGENSFDDTTKNLPEKTVNATPSPPPLQANQTPSINTFESTTLSSENLSPLELRMLLMIENQNSQIQKMQAELHALGNMMSQMGGDIKYLRHSQQRRDQSEGKLIHNMDVSRGPFFQPPTATWRPPPPPPPPPLPPQHDDTVPNLNQPIPRQPIDQPLQRGIFFPIFYHMFQGVVSFITNFRSLLLSTAPGRLYNHIRNEAIHRRAFANIDLRAIIKLMVMLAIFTGRVERQGNRRANHTRRARENNTEENVADTISSFSQIAMIFLKAHRVHVLVLAALVGFLVHCGLMSFFYEIFWVEREELMNVWLDRRNEAEEGDETNETESDNQIDRPQQDGDAIAEAQVRAGPNPARGIPNARNNRQANNDNQRGGLIRRGPNGGFLHDINCLIFSFILSLIPAWKPEEAAAPPDATDGQQEPDAQHQNVEDEGEDTQND